MPEFEVAGLVTKLAIEDSDLNKSMAELTRQMNIVKAEFQKASSGLTDFGKGSDSLKVKSDTLSKQLELQGVRVAKLHQEHAKAVAEKGKDAKETQNLEVRLNKAISEYNKLDSELRKTNIALATQTSTWNAVGESLDRAGSKMQAVGKQMESSGKTLSKYVTAPLVAAGAVVIKVGADFEKAMVSSLAIMTNVSDEMREKMESAAREVAKTTRFSATQAAEAYYFLASAGLNAAQSIEALPRVASFAQAGNFDLARATDLLTDAQSALGLASKDTAKNMENMGRVSDVLVRANTLANASVQQFSEALTNKAAAGLRVVNKDVEEGVAVLAAYADRGLKGAAAGEALNIMLRDIPRALEKNKEAFKRHNIEVVDQNGNLLHMADIVQNLGGKINSLSDAEAAALLDTLGLTRGVGDAIKQLVGAEEAIRNYERDLRIAGGTTQKVADDQIKNLWDQLGLLKSRLADASITMSETLKPTIDQTIIPLFERFISKIENLAAWFASLDPEAQKVVLGFVGMAIAAGPVLITIGKISTGVGALSSVLGKASKAMAAKKAATTAMATASASAAGATTALGTAINFMLGPVGLAIAAVAALTLAITTLNRKAVQEFERRSKEIADQLRESSEAEKEAQLKALEDRERAENEAFQQRRELLDREYRAAIEQAEKMTQVERDRIQKRLDNLDKEHRESLQKIRDEYGVVERTTESKTDLAKRASQAVIDSLENEARKAKEVHDERIKQLDAEYQGKLRLLDEETRLALEALQGQIDSIDALTKAEEKAERERKEQERVAELQAKIAQEADAERRVQLEQELASTLSDIARRQLLEQRDNQKAAIRAQMDEVKRAADERKAILQQEHDQAKQAEKAMLEFQLQNIESLKSQEKLALEERITAIQHERLAKEAAEVASYEATKLRLTNELESLTKSLADKKSMLEREYQDKLQHEESMQIALEARLKNERDLLEAHYKEMNVMIEEQARAMAKAQIEAINRTQYGGPISLGDLYPVGNNAAGTDHWRGGWTWVGEEGPELMKLPRGTKILSNQASMNMVQSPNNSPARNTAGCIVQNITINSPKPTSPSENARLMKNAGRQMALELM